MRNKIVCLLAVVLFGSVLSGCGQGTAGEKSSALKTVTMYGGTDPAATAYSALLEDFITTSGYEVQDSSDTGDETWKATVVTDFNTGNEPDVIYYFSGQTGSPIFSKVVDVETIRQEFPDYGQDITPSILEGMRESDGKIYCIPTKAIFEAVLCNTDLFEQYNLELPTDWQKFERAIETFRAEGIDPISISFAGEPHYLIESLILSAGGVAEHRVEPTTDAASVPESWFAGLDMLRRLGEMEAFPTDAATKNHDIAVQDFIHKKAAMLVDGSWRASAIIEAGRGNDVEYVAFPQIPGGKGTGTEIIAGFSSGFYITQKAWDDPEKREAAVAYVNYMTSKDGIKQLIGSGAGAPAATIELSENLERVIESGFEITAAASGTDLPIDSRLKQACWTEIWTNAGNIASGKITAQEVLEKAIPQNKD